MAAPIKVGVKAVRVTSTSHAPVILSLESTAAIRLDPRTREALSGATGVVGYRETYEPASIEIAVFDAGTLSLAVLMDMESVTVTVETREGKLYALTDGWLASSPEPDAINGTVTLRWESMRRVEEVVRS